jgi:curved DNA-binding protein CbpA
MWHPDVCSEAGATEMFQRIEQAYKRLADPLSRRKYDAGLAMEAQTTVREPDYHAWLKAGSWAGNYQPPLRCGIVNAEWTAWLGRYTALRIISWVDITNSLGQIAIPSWRKGEDKFTTMWVTP